MSIRLRLVHYAQPVRFISYHVMLTRMSGTWAKTGDECTLPGVYVSWANATMTEHGVKFRDMLIMHDGDIFPQRAHGVDTRWERIPTHTCIDVSGKSDMERRLHRS